jgi:tetratricopeptide (TPR) repeat protein
VVAAVASLLATQASSLAQDREIAPAAGVDGKLAAKRWHRAGVKAYAQRRYQQAIEYFEQADHAQPSAALSYNVARAYEALGDDARAVKWYRDYLSRSGHPEDLRQVQRRIALLARQLRAHGMQELSVGSVPQAATVLVDGSVIGVSPWTGYAAIGPHNLVLQKTGYVESARDIILSPDAALTVEVALDPEPEPEVIAVGPSAAPPPAPLPAPPKLRLLVSEAQPPQPEASRLARPRLLTTKHSSVVKVTGIVAAATGVAALSGALTFELLRRSAETAATKETRQIQYAHDLELEQSRQLIARVLAGAGAGLTLTGVVIVLLAPAHVERDPAAEIALGCSARGCGLSMRGRY